MEMNKKSLIYSISIVLMGTFTFFSTVPKMSMLGCLRLGPEGRDGCLVRLSTKKLLNSYENKIDNIERKTGTSRSNKENIKAIKKELEAIMKKYNITELTAKIKKLKDEETEKIAAKIFGSASKEFHTLNRLIKDITQDLEVKTNLKELNKLKRELEERIAGTMKKIKDIGHKIVTQTTKARDELDAFNKEKLLPLQIELSKKKLNHDLINELEEATSKLMAAKIELDKELDLVLTSTERGSIDEIESYIERLRIMLDLIENPEKITQLTPEKLLGF